MSDHLKLYLFGDQTFLFHSHFKALLRSRDNPVLNDLLVKAYNAIRTELYKLPPQVRGDIPRFTCLEDLVLWKQDGKRSVPLDMAVTCLYQLAAFISQADPGDFAAHKTRVLGLCTGALAAAAVSCSRSTIDLVPLAIDAIIVAFRTGMLVADCARRLTLPHENYQSWSMIVPKFAAVEAIDEFCAKSTLPLTSRPYVSAYTPNGVTVSGPPKSLRLLVESEHFKSFTYESIPIYGPYHALHLYFDRDVKEILDGIVSGRMMPDSSPPSLLSSPGTSLEKVHFAVLLETAIRKILLHPIRWGEVMDEVRAGIQSVCPKSFSVVPIGSTADRVIYTALEKTSLASLVPPRQGQNKILTPKEGSSASPTRPKLAIIGMSGRFPGAKNNDAFWDLLYQGLDVHKPVPPLHWDAKTHVDPAGSRKNTSATPFGCWLDAPAEFDAPFFNISPREAPQIDPAQRLALMTAYEAIEQAGLVPDATPSTRRDRVGVFYGVTSNDWMETNSAQNIDTYFIPGGNRAFIPGRINYCFKFSGPSYAVDTACSSSLAGIHLACNALWQGDIDTAIAGGTNVLTNPDFTAGLDRGHFLSRTGNCKTFDDGADGYCRGEGIGTVIIKRLDDSLADNDLILGVISGAYTNHSAESTSITRPHSGAQRAIFSRILNQGAVHPYNISYVEMHGTGTQAGDAGEMASVLDTFAPPLSEVKKGRTNDEPLYLGSAKANIGHGEAASGVSSLIKVLLMMQKDMIVPHCGIKTEINRKFPTDLRERNVNIALQPTPWPRKTDPSQPRRVFVNNFSAAGGNTALMIEDSPMQSDHVKDVDPRSIHIIAASAKAGTSLHGNLRSLLGFLKKNPDVSLGQLSYTTTARRMHYHHRAMFAGQSTGDICTKIEAALSDNIGMTRPKSALKVVFTFTGQGAQYPGMGNDFFEHFSLFRNEMLRLDQIAQTLGFQSILPVIQSKEQDIGVFSPTAVQLASVCMQIALSKLWASWNITPVAVLGHSLGEYAALNVAGVISDAETIYLVGKRAGLLQEKCMRDTHSMLVVKGSVDEIRPVLKDQDYEVSCINSPVETVLSSSNEYTSALKEKLAASGLKSTLLRVPYAFHSSQVEPILSDFDKVISGITFCKPTIPVLRPLDGQVDYDGKFNAEYLVSHARKPVNMFQALQTARSEQIITDQTIVIEIGPHPVVISMVKAVLGSQIACLPSAQRARSIWQILTAALTYLYHAGADIHWAEYQRDFQASHVVLALPAYSWNLKDYWLQYVNDWSLRKGDPPLTVTNTINLESTTIHRVIEETADCQKVHIAVETDIARKDLRPLARGHEVEGLHPLSPSIYADIALGLGTYIIQHYCPMEEESIVDVSDMAIPGALLLRADDTPHLLQTHADFDRASQSAIIEFMSLDKKQKLQEHARCVVRFKRKGLQDSLQNKARGIKEQMQVLRDGIAQETTARFNRPMVYRMLRPLVRLHRDYWGVDEVVLNSNTLEASGRVSFGGIKRGGDFHTHPAIIDCLTQSCGVAVNCNDSSDLDVEVFMSHGWSSLQIFEPLDLDKVYTTFTHMEEGAERVWHGDLVVFDGDKVVAFFGQVALKAVPRKLLKIILSMEGRSKSQTQQKSPQAVEAPDKVRASAPAGAPNAPPVTQTSSASKVTEALSIIAEASGLAIADLTDSTVFADAGIDSLMALTISACFKEDLDLDLDFHSLTFECPTVGDLKAFLRGSVTSPTCSDTTNTPSSATGVTTPTSDGYVVLPKVDFQRVLEIIAEESGIGTENLTDDANFVDLGVDSLLSLVITSRLQDELDIECDSLFSDCETVLDLKQLLFGDMKNTSSAPSAAEIEVVSHAVVEAPREEVRFQGLVDNDSYTLAARRAAVDQYVQKYTAGFSVPVSSASSAIPSEREKVILVTGASGSLGAHLVSHLAQLPDVKTVVCLNRENREEPYDRQEKAMRAKGIRFPTTLKPKFRVFQTDSSKPLFGLEKSEYDQLARSVTHLIHCAWPMNAKRPVSGFESQFQVVRNLMDFACDIVAQRPKVFKLGFQMISSIGVIGNYRLGNGKQRTMVPEAMVDIDSVLPNGYSEAKWGCERMIANTIQQYPDRFRAMIVRLGQIAGSRTSGHWNTTEHFGFLVKSSQTLNALPDVPGTAFWTTVNDVAATLSDLVLAAHTPYPIYHVENPVGQSWKELNAFLADALNIKNLVPFEEWVERVRAAPHRNNPASMLLEFLDSNYLRMCCGGLVLDVQRTLEHSSTLSSVGPVSEEVVKKYVHAWKEIGFLSSLE